MPETLTGRASLRAGGGGLREGGARASLRAGGGGGAYGTSLFTGRSADSGGAYGTSLLTGRRCLRDEPPYGRRCLRDEPPYGTTLFARRHSQTSLLTLTGRVPHGPEALTGRASLLRRLRDERPYGPEALTGRASLQAGTTSLYTGRPLTARPRRAPRALRPVIQRPARKLVPWPVNQSPAKGGSSRKRLRPGAP